MTPIANFTNLEVMQPVLVSIGKFKLYSFGSFIALGAIGAGILMNQLARKRGVKTHTLFDIILYTIVIALLAARFGYYFTYREQFQSFWQAFYFWEGGLLSLAGLFAGFLAYLYFVSKFKLPVWQLLDIGSLGLMMGWGLGSLGCHLSGCSVGRPTNSFLAIEGLLPVDLFTAIWCLVVLGVMLYIWQRKRLTDGVVFFLTMEAFLLGGLLIKTLKADFGEGVIRIETMVYLALIVATYLIFWRLHGPKIERNRIGLFFRNLVFRKR